MESTTSAKKTSKKASKKTAVKETAAKKTAVKKTAVKKKTNTASKKAAKVTRSSKKKTNLLRLYSEMTRLMVDAVDREILKRFKIIIDTGDDDITKQNLLAILKEPDDTNPMLYEERLQPYIKHYLFMIKRKANKNRDV